MATETRKCYQCRLNIPWDALVCPYCGARYNADRIQYQKLSVKRIGCLGIFLIFLGLDIAVYTAKDSPIVGLIVFIGLALLGVFCIIGAVNNSKKRKALKRKMRNQ